MRKKKITVFSLIQPPKTFLAFREWHPAWGSYLAFPYRTSYLELPNAKKTKPSPNTHTHKTPKTTKPKWQNKTKKPTPKWKYFLTMFLKSRHTELYALIWLKLNQPQEIFSTFLTFCEYLCMSKAKICRCSDLQRCETKPVVSLSLI